MKKIVITSLLIACSICMNAAERPAITEAQAREAGNWLGYQVGRGMGASQARTDRYLHVDDHMRNAPANIVTREVSRVFTHPRNIHVPGVGTAYLDSRYTALFRDAYRTGYLNGWGDGHQESIAEVNDEDEEEVEEAEENQGESVG